MKETITEISKEFKRVFLRKAITGNLSFMLLLVIVNMLIDGDFVPQSVEAVLKMFGIYIGIAGALILISYIFNQPYQLLGSLNIEDDYLKQHLKYLLYKEEEKAGDWQLFVNPSSNFMIIMPNIYVTRNPDSLVIIGSKFYLKKLQKRLEHRHKEPFKLDKI